jgi:hypothetical protein
MQTLMWRVSVYTVKMFVLGTPLPSAPLSNFSLIFPCRRQT